MQFLVLRKADAETEAGIMPSKELIDDMTAYNAKLVERGRMKSGAGLMPSSKGARVSFSNGKPTIVDGPFTEAKELIAGFSLIEANSLAEVIEIVKQWPQRDGHGNVQVEIRQIATADDLGFSPEQRKTYENLVAQEGAQQQ
ncbi:MAG: YciI family protein [Devosia sp.]